MDSYTVAVEEMQAAYKAVVKAYEELEEDRSRISRAIMELTSDHWTGEAARAYYKGWSRWDKGAQEVEQALNTLSTELSEALAEYQAEDAYHASSFGGITQSGSAVQTSRPATTPRNGSLRL